MLVVGDKEMEANEVAVRSRRGEDLGKFSLDALVNKLETEISEKTIN
jgi:threonyl-tRNA synthetase